MTGGRKPGSRGGAGRKPAGNQRRRAAQSRGGRPDRARPKTAGDQGLSRIGQEHTVVVGEVAHGGHCVARLDGQVVFVRHALPHETVRARITDGTTTSKFLRADAVEILQASAHRRPAPCPYAGPGACGGCDWQHTSAAYGRELKTTVVREQLQRLAGLDWAGTVEAVPGDVDGLRWRTRVEFAAAPNGRPGLRKHRSHDVVAVDDCLIAVPEVAASGLLSSVLEAGVSGLDVAVASDGSVTAVDLPVVDDVPNVVETVAVPQVGEGDFEVSARGFWQVHPGAAATFVTQVLDGLEPVEGDRALDLYSGVGVFTAFLADAVGADGRVLGLEGDARAVRDAAGNLADVPQAQVLRCDIGRDNWSDVVARQLDRVDLVVLDPPRSGAGRAVMEAALQGRPRRAAYVACDPAALARDLSYAAQAGYRVRSLRAFDAFPMTQHVECIAILEPAE